MNRGSQIEVENEAGYENLETMTNNNESRHILEALPARGTCRSGYWKGRVFPFGTYRLVQETTARLHALFKTDPMRMSRVQGSTERHIQRSACLLVEYLPGISDEAYNEALRAFVVIHHYLFTGEEEYRLRAMRHISRIRELLCFDAVIDRENNFRKQKVASQPREAAGTLRLCLDEMGAGGKQ